MNHKLLYGAVVFVFMAVSFGVVGQNFIREFVLSASNGAAAVTSVTQKRIENSYNRLVADLQSGLKATGVSPKWRDDVVKKIEALRKQGLDKKRVDGLYALVARLQVGGERGAAAQTGSSRGKCVSTTTPVFTRHFTDIEKINAFNPIGGIGGGSPGRSYVGVKPDMEAPVYAPVDAVVRTIIYVDRGAGYGEYGIFLKVGCDIEILFDHIDRLSDKIKKYAPAKVSASTQTGQGTEPNISIKAGELLGYSDGTELARTFDFLVMNYGKKNAYINPKRWEWEQALYPTCPYDYFLPELRAQYYAKLGKPSDQGLIKAKHCGSPSHDIAGTASGGWFKGDSTDKRGEYLAIARQYDEVQIAYRKDGQAFGSWQDVHQGKPFFNVTDWSPEKYPSEIKPGESVCYENGKEWGFVKLVSATELSFAKGNGSCPAEFPSSGAETWIR